MKLKTGAKSTKLKKTQNLFDKNPKISQFVTKNREVEGTHFTNKPRKAVWIRIAAHSCLTIMKSLGGALATVAMAAVKASSATREESDDSDEATWTLFEPLIDVCRYPSDGLLHSLHFFLFPLLSLCFSHKKKRETHKKKKTKQNKRQHNVLSSKEDYLVCRC